MTLEKAIKYYEEEAKEKNYEYQDCIEVHDMENAIACGECAEEYRQLAEWLKELKKLRDLTSAQPTLYGYNIEHLELIARVLQKENLPPERIVEVLTDIGRIVAIVKDEFEETLRKAVEQCMIFSRQDAIDALGADNNVESKGCDTT